MHLRQVFVSPLVGMETYKSFMERFVMMGTLFLEMDVIFALWKFIGNAQQSQVL